MLCSRWVHPDHCALCHARRLVNVDVYSFDFKLDHIAKHLQLPAAPRLGPAAMELPPEERLPPVLVVNLQLPTYPVSLTGHYCSRTSRAMRLIPQ